MEPAKKLPTPNTRPSHSGYPPGPALPQFVQLVKWLREPFKWMEQLRAAHGPLCTVQLPGLGKIVLISDPKDVQTLFTTSPKKLRRGHGNEIVQPLTGEESLLLLDGADHRQQRRFLNPSFRKKQLLSFLPAIDAITHAHCTTMRGAGPFEVRPFMESITMDVILELLFGEVRHTLPELKPLMSSLVALPQTPLRASVLFLKPLQRNLGPWSPGGKLAALRRDIDTVLDEAIQRTLQRKGEHPTLFQKVLTAPPAECPFSRARVLDLAKTLMVAGHETTATALTWAIYWLGQSPEAHKALCEDPEYSLRSHCYHTPAKSYPRNTPLLPDCTNCL